MGQYMCTALLGAEKHVVTEIAGFRSEVSYVYDRLLTTKSLL